MLLTGYVTILSGSRSYANRDIIIYGLVNNKPLKQYL